MPAVRLLALAPAPGQQLQLLRSAGSASSSSTTRTTTAGQSSSYSKDWNGLASPRVPSSSRAMSTNAAAAAPQYHPSTQPSWSRGASPTAVSPFLARAQRPSSAAEAKANTQRPRIPQRHQAPAACRAFGSATMPNQVAFPRHGKAVAPQQTPTNEKEAAATTTSPMTEDATAEPTTGGEPKPAPASAPTNEQRPAKTNGKRTRTASSGAKAKPAAAAVAAVAPADSAEPADQAPPADQTIPTASIEPAASTSASASQEASSVAVDAQDTLGRTDGPTTTAKPTDPAGVVAEAAATATTAAETATIAAAILDGTSPVIELGPPKVTIGAILEPGQKQQEQADQQQQQQQQQKSGDQGSSSPRQPLSQSKLLPPHLTTPPYVHHFDSYSLVKQLEAGGYRQGQAITAMKAVRTLLAQNLDVAQTGLVSKSDVENEAYLFKAACAELSIEVRNNRRRADELVRQQRTLLQHEVDIASQSVNQELVTLADVVKELFNDRKMAVREEQKTLESAIQQLSYKITIMLNSEMRSEIEGLRWVLIRRSVLGIIFMAILTLGTLRYASYVSHEKKNAAERALREAHEAEMQRFADTKIDSSAPPDAAEILAAN
ncbi:uncharacterized protein SPSK_08920 [Sporothrix schenckii 1099-18]|uniref:Moz protein represents a chromatin-associated acetyltransferase n=1 Tax=Sporothrix schenckii 1099-18 TaxID=1397361 RepID=A0A0F2M9A7_SPOSC|nr:uncharacterized protein SPSK_08920 [Sporothrix schenckii 1099-18]KJR85664.1 hypothetical protein SPSK_08920 [Sporothrix schenckii 1099-18]